MSPVKNRRLLFNEYAATGYPEPGKTLIYDESETIDPDTVPLSGGFLIKILVLSIDPYLRRRMIEPDPLNYNCPAFPLGQPLVNFAVGVILRSENAQVTRGQHVLLFSPFQEYVIAKDISAIIRVIENEYNLPWSVFIGVCGGTGQTAHHAWAEYAKPQKGDVVFVSTAAGAVGSVVVQLAKLEGLQVIASTGSDEKVEYVKSLGADVVFNYKTTSTRKILAESGPVNIYWDNVGGETLETALDYAAQQARFIICGGISGYNSPPYGVKNLQLLVWREVHMYGFGASRLMPKYDAEFFRTFPMRVAKGEIKYKEHVVRGFENAAQAIVDVQMGTNFGKCVVIIADE